MIAIVGSKGWSCVGVILGAYGIRGDLKIKSFCEIPISIQNFGPLRIQNTSKEIDVKIISQGKGFLHVRSSQINNMETASALRKKLLYVKINGLPKPLAEEYYHAHLVGINAKDVDNVVLGSVIAVYDHGAGAFLEIESSLKAETTLIPFSKNFVPFVNIDEGYITLSETARDILMG